MVQALCSSPKTDFDKKWQVQHDGQRHGLGKQSMVYWKPQRAWCWKPRRVYTRYSIGTAVSAVGTEGTVGTVGRVDTVGTVGICEYLGRPLQQLGMAIEVAVLGASFRAPRHAHALRRNQ